MDTDTTHDLRVQDTIDLLAVEGSEQEILLTIIGTLGCRSADFPIVLDLVKAGRLDVRPLVTHCHSLENISAGYDVLRRGEGAGHVVVFDRHAR